MTSTKQIIHQNYHKYGPCKGSTIQTVKKNVIFTNTKDTLKHEIMKCILSIMLHRYSDVKVDESIRIYINNLSERIKYLFVGWEKESTDFLTEAYIKKKNPARRVDVVSLRNCVHYEIETDKSIDKGKDNPDEDIVTIYV